MSLREVLVAFNVAVDQSQLIAAEKRVDGFLKMIQGGARILQGFAAALAGSALVNFITDTIKAADDVGDLAARLGVTTDEFQRLKAIADDVSTSVGAIQTGFRTLAGQMKEGSKELAALGVVTKNADGSMRSVTDVFWDAGAALGDTTDQATRLQLAQKLLGRGGLELLPIFTGGAEAIAKYRAEIAETAVVFDADFIEASDKAAKQMDALNRRLARLRTIVVSHVLPAFSWLVDKTSAALGATQKFFKQIDLGQTVLSAAGLAIARVVGPLGGLGGHLKRFGGWLRPLLPAIFRFAKGLLGWMAIDDIITLFRGGDSIIGRVLDKLLGVGASAKFVDGVKTAADSLVQTLKVVWDWVSKLGSDAPMSADEFSAAFLKASEAIGKTFDALFLWMGQKIDALAGKVKELVASIPEKFLRATLGDDAVDALSKHRVEGGAERIEQGFSDAGAWLDKKFGGVLWDVPAKLSPAASRAAGGGVTTINAPVHNEITVQGNATPAVAREIAQRTSDATRGRDRAAIGAAFGVP